jgi:hypothetical protein
MPDHPQFLLIGSILALVFDHLILTGGQQLMNIDIDPYGLISIRNGLYANC